MQYTMTMKKQNTQYTMSTYAHMQYAVISLLCIGNGGSIIFLHHELSLGGNSPQVINTSCFIMLLTSLVALSHTYRKGSHGGLGTSRL